MKLETAQVWHIDELTTEILRSLRSGEPSGDVNLVDGRALAVKASPAKDNSSEIVVGMAALPLGFQTKLHSHAAEEVALVLGGRGVIEVNGLRHPIRPGSLLLTPPNAPHLTYSDNDGSPLVILWFYAPPGSEQRWLPPK